MKKIILRPYRALLLSAAAWLSLDLASKTMAPRWIWVPRGRIGEWFYLTYHQNRGVAFGWSFGQWPQIAVSVLILAGLAWFSYKHWTRKQKKRFINQALLGIIFGGALGNLASRLYPGFVVDFIYLFPFPVFNIADIGITVGLAALAILMSVSSKTPVKTNS